MFDLVKNIFIGLLNGVITAVLGYLKSSKIEDFELKKFIQTVIIGGVVGGFAGFMGVSYEQGYEYLSSIGAIMIIEYVKKAILRWVGVIK